MTWTNPTGASHLEPEVTQRHCAALKSGFTLLGLIISQVRYEAESRQLERETNRKGSLPIFLSSKCAMVMNLEPSSSSWSGKLTALRAGL